jgi:hypothetical protein
VLRDIRPDAERLGAATRILSPEQIKAEWPWYDVEGLVCGSHNPVDEGYFDGASASTVPPQGAGDGRRICPE